MRLSCDKIYKTKNFTTADKNDPERKFENKFMSMIYTESEEEYDEIYRDLVTIDEGNFLLQCH
jgi:hypothetical protein